MLIQLSAYAFCFTAVAVALMVQQLPEHRKLAAGIESTQTAPPGISETDASPQTYANRCEGLKRKARWACQRATANADVDDDRPHEEPELD